MHYHCGAFLFNQLLRACGGRFRHEDRDWDTELAAAVCDGDPGIPARRRNETFLSIAYMVFTQCTNAAQLERAGRLQRIQLEPDISLAQQAKRLRADERSLNM